MQNYANARREKSQIDTQLFTQAWRKCSVVSYCSAVEEGVGPVEHRE